MLTALVGEFDGGKQSGGLDPGKGVWLKTARASPLILVIGLKTRRDCARSG